MIKIITQWLSLETIPPLGIALASIAIGYIILEFGFFYHYHFHLLPLANKITYRPPAPYRDYVEIEHREKLLLRILDRLCERVPNQDGNNDSAYYVYNFIESWFRKKNDDAHFQKFSEEFDLATLDVGLCPPPPPMVRAAWSSLGGGNTSVEDEPSKSSTDSLLEVCNNNSSNQNGNSDENSKSVNNKLKRGNMDEFLSWAFFGIPFSAVQSDPSMQKALENFYNILQTRGLTFEAGANPNYKPRSFTFERAGCMYRLYGVYVCVALMRMAANCILYLLGFRQYSCKRGLRYWHRPAKQQQCGTPFLFFHGIAPGGHAPYLPMIFFGLLRGQLSHRHRDIFLFENKPISYSLCFDAISEESTVHGVLEAIDRHLGTTSTATNLALCGHSFGSCLLTWMIKAPEIRNRISSLILLDPVSILLSEPDVVVNFLYARQEIQDPCPNPNPLIRFFNESKIHMVASSEMFIEHYLRRNFAWYNSELWLADVPDHVKVVVCLAEYDEIANAPKIEREIASHNSKVSRNVSSGALVEKIVWRDVGHAHCITNPERWTDIHNAMKSLEREMLEEGSHQKVR